MNAPPPSVPLPPPPPPAGTTAASASTAPPTSTTTNNNTDGTADADAAAAAAAAVPVTSIAMKLMDLRLQPCSAILQSVLGDFVKNNNTSSRSSSSASSSPQQLVLARPSGVLELYDITTNTTSGSWALSLHKRVETHSILRQIVTVRLTGEKRDLLAVASDSGCLGLIDFQDLGGSNHNNVTFTFGKTSCRRSTPGQYIAADPKGRAVMISAVEKRKLVFVLNHVEGTVQIASPLEAHRSRTLHLATVGVDHGYDHPLFACLEIQYSEIGDDDDDDHHRGGAHDGGDTTPHADAGPPTHLAYYELDLGLNHVSRQWAVPVHTTSCCLAALPGPAEGGPSGVLVGSEGTVTWYHNHTVAGGAATAGVSCKLPRRAWDVHSKNGVNNNHKGSLVTCMTIHRQKKAKFFGLVQTEVGDVFKVTFHLQENDQDGTTTVAAMQVALLDTLPPANSLNVSKKGLLFCASEFGDHGLYQFERIDLPDAPTCNSSDNDDNNNNNNDDDDDDDDNTADIVTFTPNATLQNLTRVYPSGTAAVSSSASAAAVPSVLNNPTPTTAVLVGELTQAQEVSPQVYTLAGRGPSSQLRILRHGCSVTEWAVSDLPGVPGNIFTIAGGGSAGDGGNEKDDNGDDTLPYSKYIVVSFADATLVLSVGETVEEVGRESGFQVDAPTLACSALQSASADFGMCQVHPSGVRHITQNKQVKQWHCPGLKRIECASANKSQVLIALAGGEVTYFELDALSGNLTESATRKLKADVCCLDVGTVGGATGAGARSLFCAVGCRDSTVQIISLEPGSSKGSDNWLKPLSFTTLKSRPNSIKLLPPASAQDDMILMMGLDDGSSLRATVDPVTGAIGTSPTRRFLGARPVSVSRIPLEGQTSLMLLSSRPWISRFDRSSGKHVMAPLSYAPLDYSCAFSSEAVPEGIVATAGKTLRIISIDTAGMEGGEDEAFNTNRVALRYTPRQMTLLTTTTSESQQRKTVLAVVESDYNDYGLEEKQAMGFDPTGARKKKKNKKGGQDDDAMDMDEDSDDENKEESKKEDEPDEDEEDEEELAARSTAVRGPLPPEAGHWGSCVRLLDPADSCSTLDCIEMGRNEAALCCTSVRFHTRGGESLLAVGTVTGMTLHPLKQASSHVVLYRVTDGERLLLLHKTQVDDGPVLALAHFQGRLLVGIGKTLRLYEMGKRQLLRKCELRLLPTFVKTLQTAGERAFFGDMMRSLHVVRYDTASNRLVLIANDPSPHPIVAQELLDYNTVAVSDKFGNISVLRLPRGAESATADVTGQRALWDSSRSDSTARMERLCHYYVGEIVTSMTRSSLVAGGAECLIYVTVTGRIGAFVPFSSREDVEFFTQLEGYLRTDAPRPTGRDPQSYRSYYAPVMHVVDGDLCDAFNSLPHDKQAKIAERLDRSIAEVVKKIETQRHSLL